METGIVQGETYFKTWMASLLGGTHAQAASTSVHAMEPAEFNGLRLSPESERWLSPSGHAPLRPDGGAPGPAEQTTCAADASLLDTVSYTHLTLPTSDLV